jgi:hypothetical protein
MFKLLYVFAAAFSLSAIASVPLPADGRIDIWPTIPFVRGADLCKYADAYGRTRSEYMSDMVTHAENLMYAGAKGKEALQLLSAFNQLYDRNQAIAIRHQYLDVTLESTFKAYMDQYYRDLRPRIKKLSFQHVNDIMNVVNAAKRGQRDGYLDNNLLNKLDYIVYGTYALAPNCRGDIQVTLHMIGRDGTSESFEGTGHPSTVMSQIASEIFTLYQRTSFPSVVKVGRRHIELIGGFNGSVDVASSPEIAEQACETLGGRLPNQMELELLDGYGDWSGGVSINDKVWAMANGNVYHPRLRNPTPVRHRTQVNDTSFLYYCVR